MNDIKDIRPVGFNLGGWLSQSTLEDKHTKNFIKKEDFKTMAKWGFNSVRLPVDAPWLFEEGGEDRFRKNASPF